MIKQKKVQLQEIKATSFVTSLDEETQKAIRGGSGTDKNTTNPPFC